MRGSARANVYSGLKTLHAAENAGIVDAPNGVLSENIASR